MMLRACLLAACLLAPPGLALLATGCARAPDANGQAAANDLADKLDLKPANDAPPPEGPCRLLTLAEVRAVFPDVQEGVENKTLQQYGMGVCEWTGSGTVLTARTEPAKGHTAENSVRGLADGFIDPLNAAASQRVRFEPISGVGDEAWVVLEQRDEKSGFLADMAFMSLRRGDSMVTLMSNDLSGRDRGQAIAALRKLGQQVAGRL
ncbi:MAG: hypothetical protein ABI538_09105 [Pseudoxanthomonas sp.]